MSVPEKFLAGGNVSPSGPQIHKFCKDWIVHGAHYSDLKSAGTSWVSAVTGHFVKSFTCTNINFHKYSMKWKLLFSLLSRGKLKLRRTDRHSLKVSLLVNNRARIQLKYPSQTPKRLGNKRKRYYEPFKILFFNWYIMMVTILDKNPPAMKEMWVQSIGWEDPLEKEMATHFSILVWKTPWRRSLGVLCLWNCTVQGVTKSRTWLSD